MAILATCIFVLTISQAFATIGQHPGYGQSQGKRPVTGPTFGHKTRPDFSRPMPIEKRLPLPRRVHSHLHSGRIRKLLPTSLRRGTATGAENP